LLIDGRKPASTPDGPITLIIEVDVEEHVWQHVFGTVSPVDHGGFCGEKDTGSRRSCAVRAKMRRKKR